MSDQSDCDEPRLVIDLDRCENSQIDQNNNCVSLSFFKEIYNRGKKRLNVEVCFKLDELVQSSKYH